MTTRAYNTPAEIPAELDRWNWGAFFLNWIWGIGNSTFIALLALIPGVNLIVMIEVFKPGYVKMRFESIQSQYGFRVLKADNTAMEIYI